jgi:hypothetical protein
VHGLPATLGSVVGRLDALELQGVVDETIIEHADHAVSSRYLATAGEWQLRF